MSVYSEKISIVSNFSNKASGGGYSKNNNPPKQIPGAQTQNKKNDIDPQFLKKLEQEEARLKKIRLENKKRMNKFQQIKQEALKKRIQHTNQEYEKHKQHNKKYSNFVRKKDTEESSNKDNSKSKPVSNNNKKQPVTQLFEQDSLDKAGFVNQIAAKQQKILKNALTHQNKQNKQNTRAKKDIFNQESIQQQIDVDDKIPDCRDSSSEEEFKEYFMNQSEISSHIPKKLERVQQGNGGGKQLSNYDQLAYGVLKPPSAKSAARRFNEKGGGGGSSQKLLSNVRNQEPVKLTKDSLKKFDSQVQLKLFPEEVQQNDVNDLHVIAQQQPLSWAKNQKMQSPKKIQQNQKNQRKNQQIQQQKLIVGQQAELPEEATFGKALPQLDQFTFGKQKLTDQTKNVQSRIPRINQAKNFPISQQSQQQQNSNKRIPLNRAPSVPNSSKIQKANSAGLRNKSQAAMKRKESEKAISMISERSEKQSIGGMSQDTRLQNLRMKYGNPNIKKVRPMVPRPDDPYQVMLAKQQQYLIAKKQTTLSQDNQKIQGKHNFLKSSSKSKILNKQQQPQLSKNQKKPLPQSTASEAAARDLNVDQHLLSQLKNVNIEQAKIQSELVRMHIQTHQKKTEILQKNNININPSQKSSDLFKKFIDKPLPKKTKGAKVNAQIDVEEELKESLANLDDLLIRHNIKWQKEQEIVKQQMQQKKREEQRKRQEAKILAERQKLQILRRQLKQEQQENLRKKKQEEDAKRLKSEFEQKQLKQLQNKKIVQQFERDEVEAIATPNSIQAMVIAAKVPTNEGLVQTPSFSIGGVEYNSEQGSIHHNHQQKREEKEEDKSIIHQTKPQPQEDNTKAEGGKIKVNPNFNIQDLLS